MLPRVPTVQCVAGQPRALSGLVLERPLTAPTALESAAWLQLAWRDTKQRHQHMDGNGIRHLGFVFDGVRSCARRTLREHCRADTLRLSSNSFPCSLAEPHTQHRSDLTGRVEQGLAIPGEGVCPSCAVTPVCNGYVITVNMHHQRGDRDDAAAATEEHVGQASDYLATLGQTAVIDSRGKLGTWPAYCAGCADVCSFGHFPPGYLAGSMPCELCDRTFELFLCSV